MNWYKMAQFNDWKLITERLRKELKREPSSQEIQEKILENDFNDSSKKEKELVIAQKWEDKIPGGLADNKDPKDFDSKSLNKGIKVEMEHTIDKKIATEIAMDHLVEDKEYVLLNDINQLVPPLLYQYASV